METKTVPYVATIVIVEDTNTDRNYSIVDREFFLKYPDPVLADSTWLDGTKIKERYYVVDLKEYMRVVPEARTENHEWSENVLFPIDLCNRSFKPSYVK